MALEVWFLDDEPRAWPSLMQRTAAHVEVSSGQNNLSLSLTSYDVFPLLATAALDLTGIVAPTSGTKRIILRNIGTATITLKNQSASSTAANRLLDTLPTPGDYSLVAGDFVVLVYDSSAARWLIGQKLPREGWKKELSTDGAIFVMNGHWWNFEHKGQNASGAATNTVFYRKGLTAPALDYHDSDATDQETQDLTEGEAVLERVASDTEGHAIFFKPTAAGAVSISAWPNESGQGRQG